MTYCVHMAEELVPIFRAADGLALASWYARIGFELIGEHRFAPGLPLYAFLRRGDVHLHLSEHTGDAPYHSVAYFYVDDVDTIAAEFGVEVDSQPWAREIQLTDPDGNRIRIGTVHPAE
jgi:Glyoxalase superfamily protein